MMVDSHTHLYLKEYYPDGGSEATRAAIEAGVERLVFPNIDLESADSLLELHHAFPENTFVAAGLHPTEVENDWKEELSRIMDFFSGEKLMAIGEIGIDLYWDKSRLNLQMDAFGHQLDMALQMGIPAIIHSRDAAHETIEMLRNFSSETPQIIMHSFSYTPREAEKILEAVPSAMFGFNGVITFKNASSVRESASFVGLDRILSESDSPFLTPVPHRGKTNQSSYLPYTLDAIAAATGSDRESACRKIYENSRRVFRFD